MPRIFDFRDLHVYRGAYRAGMEIFEVSKGFPDGERFGLTSQIRRSSRSVAANLVEAWRKRRYPAAFSAKLNDAEAEAAETRVHLDFALGCGYIDAQTHRRLDDDYDHLTRQLTRMAAHPERWAPGGASRRPAGRARVSQPSPRRDAGRKAEEEAPNRNVPATVAHVSLKKSEKEAPPEREDRP